MKVLTFWEKIIIICFILVLVKIQSNFAKGKDHDKVIRVAGIQNEMFMKTNKNCTKIIGGQLFKTFNIMFEKAGLRYELVHPIFKQFGSKPKNRNWTGMTGQIERQEADVAFISYFVSSGKFQIMDFSSHILFTRIIFVVKKPEKKSNWTSLIRPFSIELWIATFSTLIFCGLALHKVLEKEAILEGIRTTWTRINVFWFLFGTLVNTGGNLNSVIRLSSRIIISVWLLAIVVLVLSYSGTLMSFLTCPVFESVPTTVDELADAVRRGEFACGCMKKNPLHNILLRTKSKSNILLGNHIKSMGNRLSIEDGMKKVLNGPFAYMMDELGMNEIMKKYKSEKLQLSTDSFETFIKAYGFRKGFPYKSIFNKILSRQSDAGLIYKDSGLETIEKIPESKEIRPVLLKDILSPLALLFIGYLLSISCFIVELFIGKLYHVSN